MTKTIALFNGLDASGNYGLWVTDGTAEGTHEVTGISDAYSGGIDATGLTVFNGEVLFNGRDSFGDWNLWVTDGTAAGTHEVYGFGGTGLDPQGFTVFNGEVLFDGVNSLASSELWSTDGTSDGTNELYSGTYSIYPSDFTVLDDKVLFIGDNSSGHPDLWVTDGTAAGTQEIIINGAYFGGINPTGLTAFNGKGLFAGEDLSGRNNLWVTDGTWAGTQELTVSGAYSGGLNPTGLTVFNGKVLFSGVDSSGRQNLWVTDGTSGGTKEVYGFSGFNLAPSELTVLGNKVLFSGFDSSLYDNLWVTDGTAAGTHELTGISGANANFDPAELAVFNGEILFSGVETSGARNLWITDGTVAGTHEVYGSSGTSLDPENFTIFNGEVLFNGLDSLGNSKLWVTDGTQAGTHELTTIDDAGLQLNPSDFLTIPAPPDTTPVVTLTLPAVTATHGQTSVLASNLFSAIDHDGDAITEYAFWDNLGNGHWTINGSTQATNTEIDVDAANLSELSYTFGTASDTLFIRANDGLEWSPWQKLTATPSPNAAPVVALAASTVTATHGQTSVLASSLFSAVDPDGDAITKYAFWDNQGNGHWTVNGITQAANTEIDVVAGSLSQVSYSFGSAADTLFVRAYDGTAWSSWQSFIAGPYANRVPVVTLAAPSVMAPAQTSIAASKLFSAVDPDADTIAEYAFWDNQGNGHWTINGATQAANAEIDVAAANLSQVNYTFGNAADTLFVRAFDGTTWSAWQSFTATPGPAAPGPNAAPIVTLAASSVTAAHGQTSVLASNLFSAIDPNGDTITEYAFWDNQGNGHWTLNGFPRATNTEIDIAAVNLPGMSYTFGNAADTLFVRAYDGTAWSAWQSFAANPYADRAPVVTLTLPASTAAHGQTSIAASSLFSALDPDGDTITEYAFWDNQGNGHWTVSGATQATNAEIDVLAANLSQVSYTFGGATDTLFVRAFDGTAWSDWQKFTANPFIDRAPLVTLAVSNVTAARNQASVLAPSLFSALDPDGDAITKYAFWDNQGHGHWTVSGATQASNAEIDVLAANLSQVSYTFGNAADTLFVRAYDGTAWSAWQSFTASPFVDRAPVVTATTSAVNTLAGRTDGILSASNLFSAVDPDRDAITEYAFWDNQGNGAWTVNGATQATNSEIDVTADNLQQVDYVAGVGTDHLFVRAFDGTSWGAWQQFTATGSASTTVAAGSTFELGANSSAAVSFAGTTGTLKLDSSTTFAGTVAGMAGNDAIDFVDVTFTSNHAPIFSGTSASGTLTLGDGTHNASILLLGNYLASTFTASDDGSGGTLVVDPPATGDTLLAQPQHA